MSAPVDEKSVAAPASFPAFHTLHPRALMAPTVIASGGGLWPVSWMAPHSVGPAYGPSPILCYCTKLSSSTHCPLQPLVPPNAHAYAPDVPSAAAAAPAVVAEPSADAAAEGSAAEAEASTTEAEGEADAEGNELYDADQAFGTIFQLSDEMKELFARSEERRAASQYRPLFLGDGSGERH